VIQPLSQLPSPGAPAQGPHSPWGKLYGVGAGPGDPELITVKGLRVLQRSPLVAFPAGRNGKPGIAEQIITPWLRPDQPTLALDFPYIQDDRALQKAWDAAAAKVLPHLAQGRDVCFVSEGDVSFYSTFSYLAHAVQQLALRLALPPAPGSQAPSPSPSPSQNLLEICTIPGICSPLTAAAMVGQPLTLRQQKLLILPALYDAAALTQALEFADVVVLMKIGAQYETIWSILKAHNQLEQSYIVERASWPQQRVHRGLGDRPQLPLDYFSLWIIPVTQPPPPFGPVSAT
jgi:precorrin-2/cobalt-factor-2 C20-methyltransferase